jgi:hypothetical protein
MGATPYYAGYSTQVSTPAAPIPAPLHPTNCRLTIRQEPREALLTVKGKEKFRKPIDPPPIVQLLVNENADPQHQYLQNPYLFVAVSLYQSDGSAPFEGTPNHSLSGVLVSSLHRLKDNTNKDAGFFVFGDISVKEPGPFRLHFTLYEYKPNQSEYMTLTEITSDVFNVVLPKDFRGLEESSYLSRSFSDQGVRLRIRKESRGMASKRSYPEESPLNSHAQIAPDMAEYQPAKKRREEFVDSPVIPSSAPHINMPSYLPSSIPRQPLSNMSYRQSLGQSMGSSSSPMPQQDLQQYFMTQSQGLRHTQQLHQQPPQQQQPLTIRHHQHVPASTYTTVSDWQHPSSYSNDQHSSSYNEDATWNEYSDSKP